MAEAARRRGSPSTAGRRLMAGRRSTAGSRLMAGAEATPAAALLSPRGQALLGELGGEQVTAERALELAERLRGRYPPGLVAAALTQQALRAAARAKFSRADEMLFTRAGLEQASSELTARVAAARFGGLGAVADLCCGIGGNTLALAARGRVLAVDADCAVLELARHNAAVYQAPGPAAAVCADVRELVAALTTGRAGLRAAFIDPARRTRQRRLPPGSSEPPLDWCLRLLEVFPAVGIKAAPGLPRGLVPAGWEAEFVAVGRSLKEAVLWSPALAGAATRATVLPRGEILAAAADPQLPGGGLPASAPRPQVPDDGRAPGPQVPGGETPADAQVRGGETPAAAPAVAPTGASTAPVPAASLVAVPGPPVPVRAPGEFLLDPNPAVTRAGLVEDLARAVGGWKIDPMIAFLSASHPVHTPFARTMRVLESMPWHERRFARRLAELGIGSADIRRRGLAGDVQQIHRRLGLSGPGRATIVLTRMDDRPWGLICADAD